MRINKQLLACATLPILISSQTVYSQVTAKAGLEDGQDSAYAVHISRVEGGAVADLPNGGQRPIKTGDSLPDGSQIYVRYPNIVEGFYLRSVAWRDGLIRNEEGNLTRNEDVGDVKGYYHRLVCAFKLAPAPTEGSTEANPGLTLRVDDYNQGCASAVPWYAPAAAGLAAGALVLASDSDETTPAVVLSPQ